VADLEIHPIEPANVRITGKKVGDAPRLNALDH
jgi:hypothetical protein